MGQVRGQQGGWVEPQRAWLFALAGGTGLLVALAGCNKLLGNEPGQLRSQPSGGSHGAGDPGGTLGSEGGAPSDEETCDPPCASTETCIAGACSVHECPAGELFCMGEVVQRCAEDGLSSKEEHRCGSDEYCDGVSATCQAGLCTPGQPACQNDTARLCNDAGTGYEPGGTPCRSGESCDAGVCRPHLCSPGEGFCQDQQAKRCFDNGLGSEVVQACEGQLCVESQGTAACLDCQPGALQCAENVALECSSSGEWEQAEPCEGALPFCYQGECTATPPSCHGLTSNCGPSQDESCCMSPVVSGNTWYRSFNRENDPFVQVSTFRLDKYEVTVGRFRNFTEAWDGGWRPSAGAGKHTHLNEGMGLIDSSGTSYEAGWDTDWLEFVDTSLEARGGEGVFMTWTASPGGNETRPINGVNWYEAYAFCIWDGGFLPSELEWDYAAVGGNAQNRFPWGEQEPGLNADLAVWGCYYNGSGSCGTVANIAPVGTAQGNGRYDQADLAGNLWEWNLDNYESSFLDCSDCARFPVSVSSWRVRKGGSFHYVASALQSAFHDGYSPMARQRDIGFRCARTP